MTGDERARVRHLLRAAVAQALLPDAPLEHPGAIGVTGGAAGHLLERFSGQLAALGGAVHEADTLEAVALLVASLARREAARQPPAGVPGVLMWNEDCLPVPGLGSALRALGLRLLFQTDTDLSSTPRRAELAGALVGVTGAAAGLAETGSLVVASGPGRGRLASLLPPIHVALLERRLVVESLPDLIAQRPELMTSGANVVCITGPSRTADIEHTLSRGVHGPREVHVVLVN
jgi:L-lactate dehydrogenase complex protein LldG